MQNRIFYVSLFLCLIVTFVKGQDSTNTVYKTRNGIWVTPTKAKKINGLAVGPFQSDIFFDKPQPINGLAIRFIGLGILVPLIPEAPMVHYYESKSPDTLITATYLDSLKNLSKDLKINGLALSLSGDLNGYVNGVSISAFCGFSGVTNGLVANPLFTCSSIVNGVTIGAINYALIVKGVQLGIFNQSVTVKGIQIGLVNKTSGKGGLQIGLWNKNQKRALPIINWQR